MTISDSDDEYADIPLISDSDDEYADMPPLVSNLSCNDYLLQQLQTDVTDALSYFTIVSSEGNYNPQLYMYDTCWY